MSKLFFEAMVVFAAVGSSGCSSSSDEHAHDGASDVIATDVADDTSASDTASESSGSSTDAACPLACAAGQICCLDLHGHNPTCVTGTKCP